jgi:catechol 2,3-dioxygenase-like lactoylglutathione lyase family enzyme
LIFLSKKLNYIKALNKQIDDLLNCSIITSLCESNFQPFDKEERVVTQKSPANVEIKEINQVCILVKDIEVVAENFWKLLGIGPWSIFNWEPPLIYKREYHGKPAWARERIALAQVGNVQLELAQVVDGPSIYGDWVEERGEGLHHINYLVDTALDLDRTLETFAQQGFANLQGGRFGDPKKGYGYNYIDIPPLRTIWEPVFESKAGLEPILFPDTKEMSPANVTVKGINQIAIAVKDLEVVAENFWKILGIGPWSMYNWEEPLVRDRTYHGKPAWAREKIALAQVGGVQLELVQPVDGLSIYRDWIEEHGEGLHHINYLVHSADEFDRNVENFTRLGFTSLQSGKYGPPEKKYAYNYFDIPPLRSIWEPVYGKKSGVKPFVLPKE